jgi:nicotinamide riboside kinase
LGGGVTGKVAIVGAPFTGKTWLAADLIRHLNGWSNPPCVMECNDLSGLASFDLTLLMGLDLPTPPDVPQPQREQRAQSDFQLREALRTAKIPFSTVYGLGELRSLAAMQAIEHRFNRQVNAQKSGTWIWSCDKCSDAQCEHRLFRGFVSP